MIEKGKHIVYTAKDIEAYLSGSMTPQQMHAIEKAALDDPFLAEAMEGYEAVKAKEWNQHLVALRAELESKGTVAKVIKLHKTKNNWWKAAAAVLILASGATLTFIYNQDKKEDNVKQEIAQTIPVTANENAAEKDSIVSNVKESTVSVTQSLNPSASASTEENKTVTKAVTKADNADNIAQPVAPVKQAPAATQGVVNLDDKSTASGGSPATSNGDVARDINEEKKKAAESEAGLSRQKSQAVAPARKEAVLNNFFTAQVVSQDNTPLPFTNISIKKDNFGTYADANGVVRLVSTDSVLNVEVKSVGYLPATYTLRNTQGQGPSKIILHEDEMAFKDKTVILKSGKALAPRSRRATLSSDSAVNVEPVDGWDNYNTYVANNLDIPESLLKNAQHGEVELTFDVKSNGTISNIKINKSMGAQYDEAAKRLLQEGPQWKVKKGKKTSASIKVQF